MDSTTEALCSCCQNAKSLDQFHRDARRANGHTAQCRECRAALANSKKHPVACLGCRRHRRLDSNGMCVRCNAAGGLRQCRGPCGAMLPAFLSFYAEKAVCKDCLRARRGAHRASVLESVP